MRLSFRTKLLAAYLGLVAVFGSITVVVIDRSLRRELLASLDERLEQQGRGVARWLIRARHIENLAPRLSDVVGARVTVIDPDGIALGDSEAVGALPAPDPEGNASEVVAARRGEVGRAVRYSAFSDEEMYYVVVPASGGLAVRLAVPLAGVHETQRALRNRLLLASAVAFVAALLLGLLAVRAISRPLQAMTVAARRLGEGDFDIPPPSSSPDELGVLSRTLSSLASQLSERIGDLTDERDLLSAVLSGLVEGVLVVGASGEILLRNPSADQILGGDVSGDRLGDEGLRALHAAALAGDEPGERELVVAGRSLVVNARRLAAANAGVVMVLYDVTHLRRLETIRRDFVANVSHELRTPVTAIRGFSETLLSSTIDDATRAEFLDVIHRHAERIGRLVEDLLRLQELEAGAPGRVRDEVVNLRAVAEQVVRTLRDRADEAKQRVTVTVPPDLCAIADPDGTEQVLENLLANAVKYGGEGGGVEIGGERRGDRVLVWVADDGPGIAAEHLPRVFERFFRVDGGRSRDRGGAGLGLAIVKHLVEAMKGTVTASSEPGAGSRFSVELRAGTTTGDG